MTAMIKHKLWGRVEVLGCYSEPASDSERSDMSLCDMDKPRSQSLPTELLQYLAAHVHRVEESSESASSGSSPQQALPAAGRPIEEDVVGTDGHAGGSAVKHLSMLSRGTIHHQGGNCRPCLYLNTSVGCTRGADCQFCHATHGTRKTRPCRQVRHQYRQIASLLDLGPADTEQQLQLEHELGANDPYMRTVIRGRRKHMQASNAAEAEGELNGHNEQT